VSSPQRESFREFSHISRMSEGIMVVVRWSLFEGDEVREVPVKVQDECTFRQFVELILHETALSPNCLEKIRFGKYPDLSLFFPSDENYVTSVLSNYCTVDLQLTNTESAENQLDMSTKVGISLSVDESFVRFLEDDVVPVVEGDEKDFSKVNYRTVQKVLSEVECKSLIDAMESVGLKDREWKKAFGSRSQIDLQDDWFGEKLLKRLKGIVPDEIVERKTGKVWKLSKLNECFSFCKYIEGQHFIRHCDQSLVRNKKEKTFLSINIYLNEGFGGGATRFYLDDSDSQRITDHVVPSVGRALIFDQVNLDLVHDGEPVQGPIPKYFMRTNIEYKLVE
jgi:hypothetical protein